MSLISVFTLCVLLMMSYGFGVARARVLAGNSVKRLNSQPRYYGTYTLLWACLPVFFLALIWSFSQPLLIRAHLHGQLSGNYSETAKANIAITEIENVANGSISEAFAEPEIVELAAEYRLIEARAQRYFWIALFAAGLLGFLNALRKVRLDFSARAGVEKIFHGTLFTCSCLAVLTTVGIVGSLLFESLRFFQKVAPSEFLFGTHWSPQIAMRADQVGSSGAFGAFPLLVGTFLIACIAMSLATPVGLFSAIYLSEYASKRVRSIAKPMLEILAGIPTVVYGFFAVGTVAPVLQSLGVEIGFDISAESALAAGVVMGVMIIPFISSLSDDVIAAVPQTLRDGSFALGATKSETIRKVVLPAALPGIMGAVLLAISRAIGETMIVVMAAGLAANLTMNPLENVTTVTVQIVTILVGDQEFDSAKTLAAFALGLLLFCFTLVFNVIALQIVKRYREMYD